MRLTHLYKRVCPSVGRSVRPSVCPASTKMLFYRWWRSIMWLPLPKSTRLVTPCIRPCFKTRSWLSPATLQRCVPVNLTVAQGKNCKNLDQGASQNSQMRAKTAKCNPKWPQSCGYGGLGVVMVVLVVVVVVLWSSEIGDFVYAPVYLIFSRLS